MIRRRYQTGHARSVKEDVINLVYHEYSRAFCELHYIVFPDLRCTLAFPAGSFPTNMSYERFWVGGVFCSNSDIGCHPNSVGRNPNTSSRATICFQLVQGSSINNLHVAFEKSSQLLHDFHIA